MDVMVTRSEDEIREVNWVGMASALSDLMGGKVVA
jgi:hypothetical protein